MTTKHNQSITDEIIKQLETCSPDEWNAPWHRGSPLPKNAISGKAYRGANILKLWITAQHKNYNSGKWATYKQWQEAGAQVRKGEKSTLVSFWCPTEDEDTGKKGMIARHYPLFNVDQVDGYEDASIVYNPDTSSDHLDSFFRDLGIKLEPSPYAAYSASLDVILMPDFAYFRDSESYYAVLAHESIHWTGHKSRLDRPLANKFGSEDYAKEELVAELGAAFLCAELGITNKPRPDHAKYIKNWIQVLKEDNTVIAKASSQAQKALDFIASIKDQAKMPIAA